MHIRKKILGNFYIRLSKIIPEGKLKSILRNNFYNLASNFTMGYNNVKFKDGTSCKFLKQPLLPAYFSQKEIEYYTKQYKLKKDDVVIDAGAYFGHFTIYAAKKVGNNGKVICFEPDPLNYKILNKNIRLNKLKNIKVIKKGLYNKDMILSFQQAGTDSSLNNKNNSKNIKVNVVDLDNELKRMNISKVNFVKMDIEGAEIEAIQGCKKIMKNNNINFAIATYHIVNKEKTFKKVEEIFKNNNYNTKTIIDGKETTYAWK
jgi:FkbM family methyltransferase